MNSRRTPICRGTICILIVAFMGCSDVPPKTVYVRGVYPNDPDPATEYLLPCAEMPEEVQQSLHPWLRQMVGKSPDDVASILNERWANIDADSLQSLRARLLEFRPRSILVHHDEALLGIVRANKGDMLYVPPPLDEAKIIEFVTAFDAEDNKVFREFMRHFAGIREDLPSCAGYFVSDDLLRFTDFYDENVDGYEEWKTSMIVYHAINGDHVLMRSDGAVAWCVFPEHKVKPLSDDFDGFVKHYVEYKRIAWPFDSYGP